MTIQATGILLDGCVLSLLSHEDAYGYSLTQQVKHELGVSESTLYPVMRRLQTEQCLTAYDVPHNGRNRRYYKITPQGAAKYQAVLAAWHSFKQRVDSIMHYAGDGASPALAPKESPEWNAEINTPMDLERGASVYDQN